MSKRNRKKEALINHVLEGQNVIIKSHVAINYYYFKKIKIKIELYEEYVSTLSKFLLFPPRNIGCKQN
jgi:hypothetical protein